MTSPCEECGFDYSAPDAGELPDAVVELASAFADFFRTARSAQGSPPARSFVRARPAPGVWSALEYGCHVRDVLLVQRERVLAALRMDDFVAVPMGRDERVEHDGYAEQDPADVVRQLQDAAMLFVNVLRRLEPSDWDRTLRYPYPEPVPQTLLWVARHTVHELQHHLMDIRRQVPTSP